MAYDINRFIRLKRIRYLKRPRMTKSITKYEIIGDNYIWWGVSMDEQLPKHNGAQEISIIKIQFDGSGISPLDVDGKKASKHQSILPKVDPANLCQQQRQNTKKKLCL